MKASKLKRFQYFRLQGRRKFRFINKIIKLENHDHIPPVGRKIVIIMPGCRQMVLLKDADVEVRNDIIICI